MSFTNFNRITNEEIAPGAVFDNSLLLKIKNNFDNLKPEQSLTLVTSAIDWSVANVFNKTLTTLDLSPIAFSFTNVENGSSKSVVIKNTDIVAKTVTFTGSKWADSDPVTEVAAGSTTIFTFISNEGLVYATAVENMG